jgi:hypothetical protein
MWPVLNPKQVHKLRLLVVYIDFLADAEQEGK